ncbi:UNVERIFIED_CONTAM: hypothetical protein Q9R58_29880, partial [Methylobacteriaceae bacterium AG10]|nr:hypothetical protein [Methylobacteriaceae bacterium AG10]
IVVDVSSTSTKPSSSAAVVVVMRMSLSEFRFPVTLRPSLAVPVPTYCQDMRISYRGAGAIRQSRQPISRHFQHFSIVLL